MAELIRVHPDVASALESRRAVVALETALVAHGFPDGTGAEVAREAESRVREAGAVPATIGILDGTIRVGLDTTELDRFAAAPGARKATPRDLAACIIQGALGATTVGGTLAVCRAVGIGFMATGGIGGVHRGYADRLDISADLGELARTEALVVCSGAKSVLDVDATAELLETLAVPVLGWQTDTFPRFYAGGGDAPVTARVESAADAAALARMHWRLSRHSSLILARPPVESLDVDALVEQALAEAERSGVRGADVTPFLLSHLHEASGGRTIEVNRRLVADNAALAADVAVAYAATRP
jgi:pseudouridine-5'-phosphate glycosidase